jgi:hypothetical protein
LSSQPVQQCGPSISNEFPIPDPNCTPGVVNPSVTLDVLQDPNFRISCYRNGATTAKEKNQTYAWYGAIPAPACNRFKTAGPGSFAQAPATVSFSPSSE